MNPTPNDDVTLGELARGLAGLEGRINRKFDEIGATIGALQFVTRDVYDIQVQQLRDELAEIQERNRWVARTMVAAFLFPFLVALAVGLVLTR